jgi:hypothetical protein
MIAIFQCRRPALAGPLLFAAGLGIFATGNHACAGEDRTVAVVEQVQGEVHLDRAGARHLMAAGRAISRHDRLHTGASSRVALTFKDGSRLVLGERGAMTIQDWRPEQGRSSGVLLLDVEAGAVRLTASKSVKAPDKRVEVRTPAAVISVRGTDVWSGPIDSGTGIIVLAGAIDVRNDAGSVLIDRRHAGTIVRDRDLAPERPRGFSAEQISRALTTVDFGK